jgi:hypothetical protein
MTQKKSIPKFSTYEEEAAFWDTHSVTDYWDEMEPSEVQFSKDLSPRMLVEVAPETLDKLRAAAKERGVGPTTLVSKWILDQLGRTTTR